MNEPRIIDHDPDEPPPDRTGNGIYWAWCVILPVLWLIQLTLGEVDWQSAVLGGLTGGMFVIIMIAYTGNKVPKWMRR